jgi:hypothetical protein
MLSVELIIGTATIAAIAIITTTSRISTKVKPLLLSKRLLLSLLRQQ